MIFQLQTLNTVGHFQPAMQGWEPLTPGERFAHDYTARVTCDDGEEGGLRLEVLECNQRGMGQGRRDFLNVEPNEAQELCS